MIGPDVVEILGVPVHAVTSASWLDQVAAFVADGTPHQICTANPEFVMIAQRQPAFMSVLRSADLVLPDGAGLLWAARQQGAWLPERVTGSDGIYSLAHRANQEGWRMFLLGAAVGVAEMASQRLQQLNPGLAIAGTYAGSPADHDFPEIAKRLDSTKPHILLVAYGAPRQDLWIAKHKEDLGIAVSMGVGGSFDFVAGVQRRAPSVMISLQLEWFWRLLTQPWRWRRQLDLPRFVIAVLRSNRHAISHVSSS